MPTMGYGECDEYRIGKLKNLECGTVLAVYISLPVTIMLLLVIVCLIVTVCCLAVKLRKMSRRYWLKSENDLTKSETAENVIQMKDETAANTGGGETASVDALYDVVSIENMATQGGGDSVPNSNLGSSMKPTAALYYEDVTLDKNTGRDSKIKTRNHSKKSLTLEDAAEEISKAPLAMAVYSVPNKKVPRALKPSNKNPSVTVVTEGNDEYSRLVHGGSQPVKKHNHKNVPKNDAGIEEYSTIVTSSSRLSAQRRFPSQLLEEDNPPPLPPPFDDPQPLLLGDNMEGYGGEALYTNTMALGMQAARYSSVN